MKSSELLCNENCLYSSSIAFFDDVPQLMFRDYQTVYELGMHRISAIKVIQLKMAKKKYCAVFVGMSAEMFKILSVQ